jgi:fructose-specific phosphotransferase system IIC component
LFLAGYFSILFLEALTLYEHSADFDSSLIIDFFSIHAIPVFTVGLIKKVYKLITEEIEHWRDFMEKFNFVNKKESTIIFNF